MNSIVIDIILLSICIGSAVFLAYSVIKRKQLGIGLTHPRILVEALIMISSLIWYLIRNY